jgi:putative salt-induced outer membrane protein
MRLFLVILTLIALHPFSAMAITNMEYLRQQGENDGLNGHIEFSLSGKSGNSDIQTNSISGQLSYREGVHQFLTSGSAEYGKSNEITDTDNKFIHQRYIHHRSESLALEGFIQYQDDAFKLLDSRKLIGVGVRINLAPEENYLFNIGAGAYYTEEVYDLGSGIIEAEKYTRGNSYINFAKQLTESTTFSNTLYWQPRLSDLSDSYAYNSLSLSVKINQKLALKITLETQYDSDPVNNLEHVDNTYLTSLAYSF